VGMDAQGSQGFSIFRKNDNSYKDIDMK
jgi:hypothetical protein